MPPSAVVKFTPSRRSAGQQKAGCKGGDLKTHLYNWSCNRNTAVARHTRSLVPCRLDFQRKLHSIRDVAVVLKLHSACRLPQKNYGPGNFCNQSPVSCAVGWANVAPDGPSLAGETHLGGFGQSILVRVGLCSRGLGATINCRRSNCVEAMAERARRSHCVNSRHRFGAGARKRNPTAGSNRPDGKAGSQTRTNEGYPPHHSASDYNSRPPAFVRLPSSGLQSGSSSPE
jgi:hypothetical protein